MQMPSLFRGRRSPQRPENGHNYDRSPPDAAEHTPITYPSSNNSPISLHHHQQNPISPSYSTPTRSQHPRIPRSASAAGFRSAQESSEVMQGLERLSFVGIGSRDDMEIQRDPVPFSPFSPTAHTFSSRPVNSSSSNSSRVRSASAGPSTERVRVIYKRGSRKRLKSTSGSEDEGEPTPNDSGSNHSRTQSTHTTHSRAASSAGVGCGNTNNAHSRTASNSAMAISSLVHANGTTPGPVLRSNGSNYGDESDSDSVDHELEDKLLKFYRSEIHEAVTKDRYADAEKYIIAYLKRTGSAGVNNYSPPPTPRDAKARTMMLYNLAYAQSAQNKWSDSLATLRQVDAKYIPDIEHFVLDLLAVTLLNLGQLEEAKSACSRALKKRRKSNEPKVSGLANDSCYLMSRILERLAASGDAEAEVEGRFYKSLLPGDYSAPSAAPGGNGGMVRRHQDWVLKSNVGDSNGVNGTSNTGKVLVRKSSRAALQTDMRTVKEEPIEEIMKMGD